METLEERLARWAALLNVFQWPGDMPPGKPVWWDLVPDYFPLDNQRNGRYLSKRDVVAPLRGLIESVVGHRMVLRAHWMHVLHRTEEEFAAWWAAEHGQTKSEEKKGDE